MKYVVLMIGGTLLILIAISSFTPFVPFWIGGVMGIIVFLCVGSLVTKLIGR